MYLILFLLFTIVPMLETWLIIQVGSQIGATETVLTLVFAGFLGSYLAKRSGLSLWRELQEGLRQGQAPGDTVVEGLLVLLGALLLITPGYLSDLLGLMMFIRPVRRFLAPRLKTYVLKALSERGFQAGPLRPGPGMGGQNIEPEPTKPSQHSRFRHPISP